MYEIIPIFSGVIIGVLLARFAPQGVAFRAGVVAVAAVIIGVFAAWVSGELADNWAFALFDIAQVVAAAALTIWLAARLGFGSRAARTN